MERITVEGGRKRYLVYLLIFLMCTISYGDRAALSVAVTQMNVDFT